ncbi:hypothetical protein B7R54_17540 [Subtercola boreus]|uniref:Orc1-like AAA ATPase domain-containing protein n=1 Tax=Subtercola boreus TaxID=120213 RepID=A0A3E0VMX9_9MICO|nr:ATP-binding protein [Subtercola boreus]RFA10808.1 hypothetical protein B7R54_17540 [Subtercola boreus]TQL55616.1 AAA ATPase-like protein [Subtercola boreus]
MPNPFTPGFGTPPTVLWGREAVLRQVDKTSSSFGTKSPAHSRATIITGNRGIGKTTLLTATARRAEALGIPVLRAGAKKGFLSDIHYAADWLVDELDRRPNLTLAEINLGLTAFGIGLPGGKLVRRKGAADSHVRPFRASLQTLVERLTKRGMPGLLIIIDELNFKHARDVTLEHIVTFSGAYQSLIEDQLPVGVVISGLPIPIERARRNEHITFLKRAEEVTLEEFSYEQSGEVIRVTLQAAEISATDEATALMAALSRGNCYMIQEIGYLAYEQSDQLTITRDDVDSVRDAFLSKVINSVAGVAYDELTGNSSRSSGASPRTRISPRPKWPQLSARRRPGCPRTAKTSSMRASSSPIRGFGAASSSASPICANMRSHSSARMAQRAPTHA